MFVINSEISAKYVDARDWGNGSVISKYFDFHINPYIAILNVQLIDKLIISW